MALCSPATAATVPIVPTERKVAFTIVALAQYGLMEWSGAAG